MDVSGVAPETATASNGHGAAEPDNGTPALAVPSGLTGVDGTGDGPDPHGGTGAAPEPGNGTDPDQRAPRSFHLSRQILERARAAAFWSSQQSDLEEPTNISELVERALFEEVQRLERQYNGGLPFPPVSGRMRTGPGAAGVERIRRAQRARRRRPRSSGDANGDRPSQAPPDATS